MDWPLVLAGLALGFASTPHCAVMCGAPCAALTQRSGPATAGFHLGRLAGYMAGGAVAAASFATLAAWTQSSPALRSVWTLLHLAFFGLGLWWVATGRQPAWMLRRSATVPVPVPVPINLHGRLRRGARAGVAGLAWVAWPCAALQGALLLAALASSAAGGALTMAAFAVASAPGLAAAPWAWSRLRAWRGGALAPRFSAALGLRMAGLALAMVSGAALTHGLWVRVAAWCMS